MGERTFGHLLASITIVIWGTTFISTKIILRSLSPLAILFYRFPLAYLVLLAIHPKGLLPRNLRDELNFFLLGLTGAALYFFICFVMWGKAVRLIGVVGTSNYIYLVPLITALTSRLVLGEKLSALMVLGGLMILSGVYIAGKTSAPDAPRPGVSTVKPEAAPERPRHEGSPSLQENDGNRRTPCHPESTESKTDEEGLPCPPRSCTPSASWPSAFPGAWTGPGRDRP